MANDRPCPSASKSSGVHPLAAARDSSGGALQGLRHRGLPLYHQPDDAHGLWGLVSALVNPFLIARNVWEFFTSVGSLYPPSTRNPKLSPPFIAQCRQIRPSTGARESTSRLLSSG